MTETPLTARAHAHPERTAVTTSDEAHTYRDLLRASAGAAASLMNGSDDLAERRVAFLVPPGFDYPAIQWGIWRAGGVAVPLSPQHPQAELAYVIEDSAAEVVVAHPELIDRVRPVAAASGLHLHTTDMLLSGPAEARPAARGSFIAEDRRAMILYTSGTTGRPRGVVMTHGILRAQMETLVSAWEWKAEDRILLVLPLHHVHGIVNVLGCALWSGAACAMQPGFDAERVWQRFAEGDLSLFMAVPTIYAKLAEVWGGLPGGRRRELTAACSRMRLMVSGSAALPVDLLERWRTISGHVLLERYGMTEIGMALSNPLHGRRRPGFVGAPLPDVEVRLIDEGGVPAGPRAPGEIQVRGPGVFLEDWRRPSETRDSFAAGGWFKTGDIALLEDGAYRILGRSNIDFIKTGGYKVSAIEVEQVLRTHPAAADCAVIGLQDPEWGQRVAAAIVPEAGETLDLDTLREWAARRLAPYKLPRLLATVDELPRNAMGKIDRPAVLALFSEPDH